MRILMVAPEQLPVPGSGSVEICMLSIAKQLAKRHQVTIVGRSSPGQSSRSRMGNLQIVRVPAGNPHIYIASVLKYIKNKRFDWIQVDNRPHYMAKIKDAFPRTPVSLFLHSLTFVPKTAKVNASIRRANLIIANSASLKSRLSQRFFGQRSKIRTVHLGVDTARFKPPAKGTRERIRKLYGAGRSFVILFVGRVIPRKGVPVLIKAAGMVKRQIPHVKLLIAGGGRAAYLRKLKRLARQWKAPVRLIGRVPHTHIHRLYQAADCFVCPSQKHEAFGLVNVEAMSSGVPVIASNIGGIREIVEHGRNGYLVGSYRNPEPFARYIHKLATDKNTAAKLSQAARQTVLRRFVWSQTANKLLRIYGRYRNR